MPPSDLTLDEAAELILVAHQRHNAASCLCGWAELGRSHARHQVAKLAEAGFLREVPADTRFPDPTRRIGDYRRRI